MFLFSIPASFERVKPSNRDDEGADDTNYNEDDKSRTHTQYILKYLYPVCPHRGFNFFLNIISKKI